MKSGKTKAMTKRVDVEAKLNNPAYKNDHMNRNRYNPRLYPDFFAYYHRHISSPRLVLLGPCNK